MQTKAAVLREIGAPWQVEEITLADPADGEVQVRLAASGLCHSDEHLVTGATPVPLPALGGHEGAGIVTKVGPGVRGLAEGDHVVLAFLPACGTCRPCASGLQNLCDRGAELRATQTTPRATTMDGLTLLRMCQLGTFAPYVTVDEAAVIKIEDDVPLDLAALLGCGVSTGWGSATAIGNTRPGDTVVVIGVGGVGINAVQGAAAAGARFVVAVDPVAYKQKRALELGATHTFSSAAEAQAALPDLTWGRLAQVVILTVGHIQGHMIQEALALTAKGGQVVVTAMGHYADREVSLNMFELTLLQKRVKGAIFGGVSPRHQIPLLLEAYRSGNLKLAELVTPYQLEDINQGYQDMRDGKNLRGLIRYTDADY
jgi:S-(hydroxymethyl)glutathione dehydrogenase/alcohol dehydrogenase